MDFQDLQPGPAPQLGREVFQRRREEAARRLAPGQVVVVATHPLRTYSNDVEHVFRPHSDFWYLTGFAEPGAALVLEEDGASHLFLRPRKREAEIWTGRRLGVERAAETLGVDAAHDLGELPEHARALLHGKQALLDADHEPAVREAVMNALGDTQPGDARPLLADMRLRKDTDELRMLREAGRVGSAAMQEALDAVAPGRHEYEVEAELLRHYRAAGTVPGYPPIVGAGPNATVLHYIENRARIKEGDMVLIDAGCEWGYYNSDITRTVCAGGPTSLQTDLYEAVWKAQQAAIAKVRPGNRFHDPHTAAVEVLVDALVDLEILAGDKEQLVEAQAHRDFFMHGTSHFLGLDVHDVGGVKDEQGESRRLEEGMCLTVEPGLYFNPDFARCPDAAIGIGIRIEDDLVVTEDGHENLTHVPSAPDQVLAQTA